MSISLKQVRIVKLETEGIMGAGVALKVSFLPMYQPVKNKPEALVPFGLPIPVEGVQWWSAETVKKLTAFIQSAEKDLQKAILGEDSKPAEPSKELVMPEGKALTGLGNIPPSRPTQDGVLENNEEEADVPTP